MKKKPTQKEIEDAKVFLRKVFGKNNRKVYTVLRHVSQSGMSRRISCIAIVNRKENGKPTKSLMDLDYWVSLVTQFDLDKRHNGLRVGGCGMDMGFHVVYSLSHALYGKRDEKENSGYVLTQSWI